MYNGKKILCVIPARGGSKGLPNKNVKNLLGKPLISYSIEHAQASKYIDRVIVSTEDDEIAATALKWGAEVPFLRPKHLASDEASTIDVLLHAIEWAEGISYQFEVLVLLHVTTPLRSVQDVDRSIELLVDAQADSVFSVTEAHRNPYFNMIEVDAEGRPHLVKQGSFTTRQSAPPVYDMNSSIYVWWKNILKDRKITLLPESRIYLMPKDRSVDIDDMLDFKIAEMILKGKTFHV